MAALFRTRRNISIAAIIALSNYVCTSPVYAFNPYHKHAVKASSSSASAAGLRAGSNKYYVSEYLTRTAAANRCYCSVSTKQKSFQRHGSLISIHVLNTNRPSISLLSASSSSETETADQDTKAVIHSGEPNSTNAPITPQNSKPTLQQDIQNIATLLAAQGVLILISPLLSRFLQLPNLGLGSQFSLNSSAFLSGLQWTLPLFGVAAILQIIEPHVPALKDVTKATQRSVLAVMGPTRRPFYALIVSILLGAVAGWGEEWLFRGVFQTILGQRFGNDTLALGISGVVFGLLHAVTPIYALLAATASVFFGYLYNLTGNLAVPMVCHAVYDVGALMWAHWSVTGLSKEEQEDVLNFGRGGGAPILSVDSKSEGDV
mmetsp:Transcript_21053/g.44075  ORF Transcript_21053/g.44075 Transcript_21053/m.44075 type:complete len:375 (-) Transcript_21053:211-1335(-)